ncbi:MAG TPA: Gfo/Idh/MocA family oxidoreductase [Terriglobales bacterium]|nr:Gfo/Idh/MocA family oxidoreductase [Terriglobales bacterium]
MGKLGVAVVGSGIYGEVHARTYSKHPEVELLRVWSRSASRAKGVAEKFGCQWSTHFEDVLDDDRIQLISVATPDHAHTEYALAALKAGKHVLLEKPMAQTGKECKAILAARDASGAKLMVNYHNRWYPAFIAARDAIAAGKIGKPVCANFVLSDTISWVEGNMTWAEHSGPEWFLMSHIADLAFWMLNDRPDEVYAMASEGLLRSKGFHTKDVVKATMRMKKGAIVHFESTWVLARNWRNPVNDMWLSVQGETGRIDVLADYENITITSDRYQTPFVMLNVTEEPPIVDFVACVRDNQPSPVTGEEGMLATQAIEAVVESYNTNKIVKLS